MEIKRVQYKVEETNKKRRKLTALRVIMRDFTEEEFKITNLIIKKYTKTVGILTKKKKSIETQGTSFEILYGGIPFFVFGRYRGGKIYSMEYKNGICEGYFLSILPRNRSYALLEEVMDKLKPKLSKKAESEYNELKELMEESLAKPKFDLLQRLQEELEEAVEREEYERAAKLRDRIARLSSQKKI